MVIYVCFFFHTPFFTRRINDKTLWLFLVVIYVEEQPLYKDHCCFSLIWICHVKNIMQCYHNSKSMDKVYASTHRDVFNFNMKNTFLVRQHIMWRKVHTTNDNLFLSFLEKKVKAFLGDGRVDNIQPHNIK